MKIPELYYLNLNRSLIGLTNENTNTMTYFPKLNFGYKINKGEYIKIVEHTTRYILDLENGTYEETYYEFFISHYTNYIILVLSLNIFMFLILHLNINININFKYVFLYLFISLSKIYFTVVFFYWNNYKFYSIK